MINILRVICRILYKYGNIYKKIMNLLKFICMFSVLNQKNIYIQNMILLIYFFFKIGIQELKSSYMLIWGRGGGKGGFY